MNVYDGIRFSLSVCSQHQDLSTRNIDFPGLDIPHGVTEDDTYDGYLIPKGSRIVVNNW